MHELVLTKQTTLGVKWYRDPWFWCALSWSKQPPRSETGSYIPNTVKSYIYTSTSFLSHAKIPLFTNSRLCIFLWSLGGWILATSSWWGSGRKGSARLCCTLTPSVKEVHSGTWEGRWGTLGLPQGKARGSVGWSSTGGPAALSLGRPGGPSCRTGCWRSSATVGYISFHCWHLQQGKSIACIGYSKKQQKTNKQKQKILPFCTQGFVISETRNNKLIFKHPSQIAGR